MRNISIFLLFLLILSSFLEAGSTTDCAKYQVFEASEAELESLLARCSEEWREADSLDLGTQRVVLTDELLEQRLGYFPNIHFLNIDHQSKVTGSFLNDMKLVSLREFWAAGTRISDESLQMVEEFMPNLERFNLNNTPISPGLLELLGKEKINLAAKTWDLRRVQFEVENNHESLVPLSSERRLKNIEMGVSFALLTAEAAAFIKENDLTFMLGMNPDTMEPEAGGVYQIGHEEL